MSTARKNSEWNLKLLNFLAKVFRRCVLRIPRLLSNAALGLLIKLRIDLVLFPRTLLPMLSIIVNSLSSELYQPRDVVCQDTHVQTKRSRSPTNPLPTPGDVSHWDVILNLGLQPVGKILLRSEFILNHFMPLWKICLSWQCSKLANDCKYEILNYDDIETCDELARVEHWSTEDRMLPMYTKMLAAIDCLSARNRSQKLHS